MKKVVNLNLGNVTLNDKIVIVKPQSSKGKKKTKIRNNPKRKGRIYND